ncbi:MAG: hypothetical protein ACREHF_14450 [Rhizomicrobium sp.]
MFEQVLDESPAARARQYRALAMTAEASAAVESLPQLRAAYLRTADRWNTLAGLLELGSGYAPRKIAKPAAARSRTRTSVLREAS